MTQPAVLAVEPPIDIPSLIERGCYTCLERAFAAARERNAPEVMFEAAALLAVRSKELGLPHDEWLRTAIEAANGEPSRVQMLDVIAAIPVDPLSGAREEAFARAPAPARLRPNTAGVFLQLLDKSPGSLAFRSYLQLALRCSTAGPVEEPAGGIPEEVRHTPLLRYRLGLCGDAYTNELRAVREADADFADVDYALARYAVQQRPYPDLDGAIQLLHSAAAAFPRSSAIATTLGDVYRLIDEWNGALRAYDAALVLVADHPDALRGRTISLSSLNEHTAAIETATRMVNGRWFVGEALYWRAWNHFQLGNHEIARVDADRMKTLMINAGAYLLSGLIDWRLRRLESADTEFQQSLAMDAGLCEAASFLAGVRNERGMPTEALAGFTHAKQCFELTLTVQRRLIAGVQESTAPESYKLRQIARHERAIEQAERRRAEAINGIELLQKYLTSIQAPQKSQRP